MGPEAMEPSTTAGTGDDVPTVSGVARVLGWCLWFGVPVVLLAAGVAFIRTGWSAVVLLVILPLAADSPCSRAGMAVAFTSSREPSPKQSRGTTWSGFANCGLLIGRRVGGKHGSQPSFDIGTMAPSAALW
jgi:hypothetical protein